MPFNQYYIGTSDYDFYKSLPADEKLLFLHDLICTDYYNNGTAVDLNYIYKEDDYSYSEDINSNSYRKLISDVLDHAIDPDSQVNVIFINELVVFNSDSIKNMSYAILDLAFDGVVLKKMEVPENIEYVFKKQEYCQVFKVLDISNPIL